MLTKIKLPPFILVFWIVFMLLPASILAEIREMSTMQIIESSTRAVLAKCISVEVKPVEKYGGNIFTFSKFKTLEKISGDIGDEFTLRLYGGEFEDVVIDAPMMPSFMPEEAVILLLGDDNNDGYPIIFVQGVFRLGTNSSTNEKVVMTPVTDTPIYRSSDGSLYATTPTIITVEDFKYTISVLD